MFRVSPEAYDRHVGRYGAALARALIGRAGVGPGQRLLDVGCGPGALTRELVAVAGAGHVAAVDPSAPFVQACRARLPGVDVRVGRAEALPFEDGSFDGVLSQLVVNFMADPGAGVAEMRRVTRAGGVVAACVWDYAGGMTFLRAFWDAAVALDPAGAGPLDEGLSMRHCDPDSLGALWRSAGLGDVAVGGLVVTAAYDGLDDLWSPIAAGVGPSGAYCTALDDDDRAALEAEMARRLGSPAGPFELSARAWYAVGRV